MKENAKKAPVADSENPKEDWYPTDIISALNKAGYTMAKLAEEHGLKSGGDTFSKALRRSYPIAEQRIADALNLHPMVIWPSRYEIDGTRKLQGFHNLESTRRTRNLQAKQAGVQS